MPENDPDIICAPATPRGCSAMAILRLSGRGSCCLVEKIMGLKDGRLDGMRRVVGYVRMGERSVDQAVVLSWPEGSSYTGEEMVEVIPHGIPEVIDEILAILLQSGARMAQPGEFTARALANGVMTPLQALALAERWTRSEDGEISPVRDICRTMAEEIDAALEILEGGIEFDEILAQDSSSRLERAYKELKEAAGSFSRRAGELERGLRILIMGPFNSGKSTLFNLIAGDELALTSNHPCTTRDGAREKVRIGRWAFLLQDTAGSGGSGIDGVAYESVVSGIADGDLVLWMSAGGRETVPKDIRQRAGRVIEISSKCDVCEPENGTIAISSVTGEGVESLRQEIEGFPGTGSVALVSRRIQDLVEESCDQFAAGDLSLASQVLQNAAEELGEMLGSGRNISESVERALNSMCVGK